MSLLYLLVSPGILFIGCRTASWFLFILCLCMAFCQDGYVFVYPLLIQRIEESNDCTHQSESDHRDEAGNVVNAADNTRIISGRCGIAD